MTNPIQTKAAKMTTIPWWPHWGNLERRLSREEETEIPMQEAQPVDRLGASTVEATIDRGIALKDQWKSPKGPVGSAEKKDISEEIVPTRSQVDQSSR